MVHLFYRKIVKLNQTLNQRALILRKKSQIELKPPQASHLMTLQPVSKTGFIGSTQITQMRYSGIDMVILAQKETSLHPGPRCIKNTQGNI